MDKKELNGNDYETPMIVDVGTVTLEDGSVRCTTVVYCTIAVTYCSLAQQYMSCNTHSCKNDATLFCDATCVHLFNG